MLVSHWNHTSAAQVAAMRRLAGGLAACDGTWQGCTGSLQVRQHFATPGRICIHTCLHHLQVRQYYVPGWNQTGSDTDPAAWPSFSRVNHAKYIVSERRLNVGTSNWAWGYFHQTAGASFNTNESGAVASAQAVFDADWSSGYATPV